MKRRKFGLMAACGAAALSAGVGLPKPARAAGIAADKAGLLKTTLTPLGSERAGNADGSIPAWTGGEQTVPAGWNPNTLMPDIYASDAKLLTINASNMEQYKDRLSVAVMKMMTMYPDFRIDVYPTHRSHSAPQYVYDNIYKNALNAIPNPGGSRLGFSNAFGGVPFPIPDDDPKMAGAQIIWNHNERWTGLQTHRFTAGYVMNHGQLIFATGVEDKYIYNYYDPNGSAETFDGISSKQLAVFHAPAAQDGQQVLEWIPTNPLDNPQKIWEFLNGQGRVRKAPELNYDTPSSFADGVSNFDEYFVFYGSPDRYDWTLLEKKEVYVPYNNNKLFLSTPQQAHLPEFIDPDLIRWELHRVWVIDAVLHPGDRNVIAHRRFYCDEDTWMTVLSDEWDANGNIWKCQMIMSELRPDLPGLVLGNSLNYNLQTGEYISQVGPWNITPYNGGAGYTEALPPSTWEPQTMAANDSF